jgi:hypothetical protein
MREREKVNSKSKLEKLLEQNVTYTLRWPKKNKKLGAIF